MRTNKGKNKVRPKRKEQMEVEKEEEEEQMKRWKIPLRRFGEKRESRALVKKT
jgi:hypothetical protein